LKIGIEEDETLQQTAIRRKLGFGHVMRSGGVEKRLILACREGGEERATKERIGE